MIDLPLLDELREIRRRLSEECQGDVEEYARMLQQVPLPPNAVPVSTPLLPTASSSSTKASA